MTNGFANHQLFVLRQIRLKMRWSECASFQSSRAADLKLGSETARIRRKNFVSRDSLRQVPMRCLKSARENAVVRFAVVRPYTSLGADELIDQTIVDRIPRNLFCQKHDVLGENRRALLQVVNHRPRILPNNERL